MKRAISGHIPPGQLLRYLLVGGWNTVFGYVCFFLMNSWLSRFVTWYPYIVASLSASLISISVAFLGYKWFVFRTRGNYLREWLRTLTVYSGSVLIATVALAPLVGLIRHATRYQTQAPYIAGALISGFIVISSFLGHRNFSFRKAAPKSVGPGPSATDA
jgi:putative flippase GtrA